jgi:ubiquinone/menaquinone biosynthesis C-methylase UbiE
MLKIAIILFVAIIILTVIWRLYSKRHLLPCPAWLSWLVELDNPFASVHKASSIVQNLDLHSGMSVLDVGCGTGRVTIPIAKAVEPTGEVTAMDTQLGMLEKTRQKAVHLGLTNIKFLHGEIGKYVLEANKYDRIILVTVLGEIPNQNSALKHIFNALKPEGILSITEIIFDPHFQSRKKVIELALSIGFIQKQSIGKWFAYTINFEKKYQA